MSNYSAVILAAGMGTRMKSDKSKVLHKICSKPLVKWVYEACLGAGCGKTVMVVGHKKEDVIAEMGSDKLYAVQEQRLGTGHAVMMAEELLKGEKGTVVILNGDTPLITAETIKTAVEYHEAQGNSATVISAVLDDPASYGRIIRDENGSFCCITEYKDATEEQRAVCEINSGMYCFDCEDLFLALSKVTNDNVQKEYYLTDTMQILKDMGKKADAYVMTDSDEILGVNDRVDLAVAAAIMQKRINTALMKSGVTLIDPDNTYIDAEVSIAPDTIVYPGCHIRGNTVIGAECEIGPSTTIESCEIGSNTKIQNSVACDSKIGSCTSVGPFAYIRPNSDIGNHIKIGDFVEIKNSTIADGTKVSHLTYVGDSDVGEGVNFGCGTVTVNYDGKNKHRTVIGDNVFIGCNANLVAPVTINDHAFIAAGSTITEDVESDALAIARARQVVKSGWYKR
ncbi:MAG: bifunctional UDP-N-acetylglucosamine diphosphorylase/glucosamine-1-phosphate N-acetyltransferase GlmU [Clostridia bacterium]|nr:bifunctional UDP-N-acetylglucosamine diphosphorylase/glucosamine-1-phosphate N-acetyltransferase GlmU [Clostridia bacterium]